MRVVSLLLCVICLTACAEVESEDDPIIVPELSTANSLFDAFVRLPKRLHEGLKMRKSHVDHVAIEDIYATQFESEELVELLVRWQPYIVNLIEASHRIEPPLPAEPKYTDAELTEGAYLNGITARVFNNSRLLVTDALRCWSIGDYDGCGARFDAVLRMAICSYRSEETMHQHNGTLLLQTAIIELELRINDGLGDKLAPDRVREILDTARDLQEARRRAGIRSRTGDRILGHLIEVFSQEGE